MDTVRKIAISLAEKGSADLKDIDEDLLQYHLWIMKEAGLINNFIRFGPEGGSAINSVELTWAGNEFLEAARNDSIWNKAKSLVLDKTGAASFEIMKAVLIELALKAVK